MVTSQSSRGNESRRYTRFINTYLVLPSGELTDSPSTLWIDRQTGKIVHLGIDDLSTLQITSTSTSNHGVSTLPHGIQSSSSVFDPLTSSFIIPDMEDTEIIDLDGAILAPGLIDVQINGAFGVDFSDWNGDRERYFDGVSKVSKGLVQTGVTGYVATVISQIPETYPTLLPLLTPTSSQSYKKSRYPTREAHLLGYHLEGPFLSPKKPGCHPQQNLRDAPDGWRDIEKVYGEEAVNASSAVSAVLNGHRNGNVNGVNEEKELEGVKIVTLAPEVKGVGESVKRLVKRGWVVSIGHSDANTAQALKAVADGATMITHLYNAMPQLHHRDPGIVGLLGLPSKLPTSAFNKAGKVQSMASTPIRRNIQLPLSTSKVSTSPEQSSRRSSGELSPEAPDEIIERAAAFNKAFTENNKRPSQFGDDRNESINSSPSIKRPYFGIIVDGVHCHPQAVNFAYKAHPQGCVLVTDAVQLMDPNLPDGTFPWRDSTRIVKSGSSITLEGTDTLAGSAVTLDECVRNLSIFANIPLSKAIFCASTNAARSLGEGFAKRKGSLGVGFDADLSIWERETGRVIGTWVSGERAFGL